MCRSVRILRDHQSMAMRPISVDNHLTFSSSEVHVWRMCCGCWKAQARVSKAAIKTWNIRVTGTFIPLQLRLHTFEFLCSRAQYVRLHFQYEMTSLGRYYNMIQLLPPTTNGPIKMALSEHTPCVTPQAGSSSFAFHQSASSGLPDIS